MVFCLENSLFIISCSIIIFTVNGNYTQWTDWSTCSHSCGPGFMLRSRTCTNPSPSNGGLDCTRLGRPVQSTQCYLVDCPGIATQLGPVIQFSLFSCSFYLLSCSLPCRCSIAYSTMNFTAGLVLAVPQLHYLQTIWDVLFRSLNSRTLLIAFRTKNSDVLLKHNLIKFTPIRHELYRNNICENDSFTVLSMFYRYTDEKITH